MFVVANRIPVAEGRGEEFEDRFRERAGLVEDREGFVRLEVLRPVDADRYVVLTHWESEDDFEAWTDSEAFRTAHSESTPEGLVQGHPDIEKHRVVTSAEPEH
ncbi:antibiotic biosynthesis monooxygenase family protein [Haloplanus halobius]|uniref:antibiotic biosynthesis monooxygenase family protein n=1 Tax=Haloplanus halobius TaxID=2934938 RepID=UPI00200BC548|nr:antibiotic biosynthesis monooxygenase [Haloplanus sp. XH21]